MKFQVGKVDWFKIIKISAGCCLSVTLAALLGLRSSTSAGIIALLSIQHTKRETLRVALKRGAAFFAAVGIAYAAFSLLGYRVLSFGAFLFCFVLCCYLLRLQEGISMNTVLVSHIWAAKEIGAALLLNEFALLCIGVGVGVLVNLFMPRKTAAIRADQRRIDDALRSLLRRMSAALVGGGTEDLSAAFDSLREDMDGALARAYENRDNSLTTDMRYYVEYIELRMAQCAILRRIAVSLDGLAVVPVQAHLVSCFMEHIADSFHEYNNAAGLAVSLAALRGTFKEYPLPKTRAEFETRAVLFEIVNNLEYLILAKKHFAESLTPWQIRTFWREAAVQ